MKRILYVILLFAAAAVTAAELKPEMRGFYVGRNPRPYRPAVTLSHEKEGAGEQEFLTLLYPVRCGSPDGIREVRHTGRQIKVKLNDNRTLKVELPTELGARPKWTLLR